MAEDAVRYEMTVLRAGRAIRHAFNARLEDVGLTVTAATLLAQLVEQGPMTQRELAERVQISAASTGTVVDGLVERGLVERHADPTDRRVWRIIPTAAAVPYVDTFRRIDADVQDELRNGLDRSDLDTLTRLLGTLERNAIAAASRQPEPAVQD